MRILESKQVGRLLARKAARIAEAEAVVRPILEAVRQRGDRALLEYARQFDALARKSVRVPGPELAAARGRLAPEFARAVDMASANIRAYAVRQMPAEWTRQMGPGLRLGPVSYTHLDVYKRQLWNRPPQNYRTKPFSTPNPKKTRLIPSFRGEPIPAPATLRRAPSQLRHRGRNSSALVPVRRRPSGAIRDKTPTEAIFKPQPKENKHIPSMRDEPIKPRAAARHLAQQLC